MHKLPEPPPLINFSYPLNYPFTDYDDNKTVLKMKNSTTANNFRNGHQNAIPSTSSTTASKSKPLNVMHRSQTSTFDGPPSTQRDEMSKSLNVNHTADNQLLADVPAIRKIPDYMHIPNLWDIKIEKDIETSINVQDKQQTRDSSGSSCSEWEFV